MPAGCSTCFITKAMCDDPSIKGKPIDHSVTLVGFGTDAPLLVYDVQSTPHAVDADDFGALPRACESSAQAELQQRARRRRIVFAAAAGSTS